MQSPSTSVRQSAPARLGTAGRIGVAVLALMLLACVGTLPWSMGGVQSGPATLSRYEASNLSLNL
ncbi:MAG: hypothetical protein RL354_2340, partial [Planctomycetota bacterium]